MNREEFFEAFAYYYTLHRRQIAAEYAGEDTRALEQDLLIAELCWQCAITKFQSENAGAADRLADALEQAQARHLDTEKLIEKVLLSTRKRFYREVSA